MLVQLQIADRLATLRRVRPLGSNSYGCKNSAVNRVGHGSLKSPACSRVSITLPASSETRITAPFLSLRATRDENARTFVDKLFRGRQSNATVTTGD